MEFNFIKEKGLPPPINKEYILLDMYGEVFCGEFYDGACFEHYGNEMGRFFDISNTDVTDEIVAWMPLPPAPNN